VSDAQKRSTVIGEKAPIRHAGQDTR
jgi:hypothetical protein